MCKAFTMLMPKSRSLGEPFRMPTRRAKSTHAPKRKASSQLSASLEAPHLPSRSITPKHRSRAKQIP